MNVRQLIEPDRVHRRVYTDQQIFDREMTQIFERVWVYCGHQTQVPQVGDYYAFLIGRQPMFMVRGKDRQIHVLHNRCPHRGVQLCGNQRGNVGSALVCSYHAWSFQLDGRFRSTPMPTATTARASTPTTPTPASSRRPASPALP